MIALEAERFLAYVVCLLSGFLTLFLCVCWFVSYLCDASLGGGTFRGLCCLLTEWFLDFIFMCVLLVCFLSLRQPRRWNVSWPVLSAY